LVAVRKPGQTRVKRRPDFALFFCYSATQN
jgi:hypothetical protein